MESLREEVVLPSGEATVTWNCSRCVFSTSTRTITGTCSTYAETSEISVCLDPFS